MAGAGIYAIENCRTGRVYIGATKRGFRLRWNTHRTLLHRGKHPLLDLQCEWQIYGCGWFKFIQLQDIQPDQPFAPHEQAWIDRLRAEGIHCYNSSVANEMPLRDLPLLSKKHLLHTVGEAAELLRCNRVTIVNLIKQKKIYGFKLRHSWRIRKDTLLKFVEQRDAQPRG